MTAVQHHLFGQKALHHGLVLARKPLNTLSLLSTLHRIFRCRFESVFALFYFCAIFTPLFFRSFLLVTPTPQEMTAGYPTNHKLLRTNQCYTVQFVRAFSQCHLFTSFPKMSTEHSFTREYLLLPKHKIWLAHMRTA